MSTGKLRAFRCRQGVHRYQWSVISIAGGWYVCADCGIYWRGLSARWE